MKNHKAVSKADVSYQKGEAYIEYDSENTYTMQIKGMMCPHCEATVKKILEEFSEVDEAAASFEKGTAVLTLNSELIHLDEMEKAVKDKGYSVIRRH